MWWMNKLWASGANCNFHSTNNSVIPTRHFPIFVIYFYFSLSLGQEKQFPSSLITLEFFASIFIDENSNLIKLFEDIKAKCAAFSMFPWCSRRVVWQTWGRWEFIFKSNRAKADAFYGLRRQILSHQLLVLSVRGWKTEKCWFTTKCCKYKLKSVLLKLFSS